MLGDQLEAWVWCRLKGMEWRLLQVGIFGDQLAQVPAGGDEWYDEPQWAFPLRFGTKYKK